MSKGSALAIFCSALDQSTMHARRQSRSRVCTFPPAGFIVVSGWGSGA